MKVYHAAPWSPDEYQCYRYNNGTKNLVDFNGCKAIVNVTDLGLEVQEKILNLTAPITDVWWACTSKDRHYQKGG
jgi:hypothetical protein